MVNHEQRAQLNAINSYTELIIQEFYSGKFDKDEIISSVKKIQKLNLFQQFLISDFLDSSKINLGRFSLNKESFDVKKVCEEVIEL